MENRVKLMIAGNEYTVTTDESEEYMATLAKEVDVSIRKMVNSSNYLSTQMAAVLTALNYCDRLHKAQGNTQPTPAKPIGEFSDANSRAQLEIQRAYREIEQLNRENRALREQLGQ